MALERTRLEAEQNSNQNSERNSEENAGQKLPKNSQDGQDNGQADRPVDTQSLPETLPEDHEATNQREVGSVGMAIEDSAGVNRTNAGQRRQSAENSEAEQSYYLVAEDGFLLVFLKDRKTICLYTHMPLMDFSVSEQERLREGIWFSSMLEVFNYLESCTS